MLGLARLSSGNPLLWGQMNLGFAETTAVTFECTHALRCPRSTRAQFSGRCPTHPLLPKTLFEQAFGAEVSSLILVIFHFIENLKNPIRLNIGSNIEVWKSNFSFLFLIRL